MLIERYSPKFFEDIRKRILIFFSLIMIGAFMLVLRIWYLQVIEGSNLKIMSENNRIRNLPISGYRGTIFDRNKEVLVNVRPSFNLYLIPENVENIDNVLEVLSEAIDIDRTEIKKRIKSSLPFNRVLIKRDIRRDIVAFIEEHHTYLQGVVIDVESLRGYKNKEMASHLLGYLNEINKSELEKLRDNPIYRQGDFVGRYGIEMEYEGFLRGESGEKHIEVDAYGRETKVLNTTNPAPGNNLVLTLDINLQREAERLLNDTGLGGAIAVIDPNNGGILAMVSKPSFDPNIFAVGINKKEWIKLVNDKEHPLQNRSIQGQYPPGSTYKILTAIAGLEEGIINTNTAYYCPGFYYFGNRAYRCWKEHGHSYISVERALIQSCDVFFYQLGIKLGIDNIAKYGKMFGLSEPTGIDMYGEKSGIAPSTKWKETVKKEEWLPGETISASVGQGYNLVTPLQMANLAAAFANKGTLWKPRLVQRIEDIKGNVIKEIPPTAIRKIKLKPETINIVGKALFGVLNDPSGTAARSNIKDVPGLKIYGKTGTAQVIKMKERPKESEYDDIPVEFRDHAWFVSYAEINDQPKLAIAVIVEHGGFGGRIAAPITRDIIREYVNRYYKAVN